MRKKLLLLYLYIFIIILISFPVIAITIGVSPGIINSPNMLKNGYAEKSAIVTTNSIQKLKGHLEVEGEIKDWISFIPDSDIFNVSLSVPYRFNIIIRPSADAKNGNYSGIIRLVTDELATVSRGAGSSVIAAVAIKINIEIIGKQIILCRAGAFSVGSAEVNTPFTVAANVFNDGNVRIRPQFTINVWDQSQQNVQMTKSFFGDEILPTTNKRILKKIQNDLDISQYFAEIFIKECAITQLLTFDIVEKGGIVDLGDFIGIKTNEYTYTNEPTPIVAVFRNIGPRSQVVKFKGEIISMTNNKVIQVLETEEIEVEPSNYMEFKMFFIPKIEDSYQVSGRIIYNKKITFEEKSKIIKVLKGKEKETKFGSIIFIIIYIIIGLIILILISKIRKEKKKRKK